MAEKKSLDSEMIKNVLNYWYSFDFLGQSALQTELNRQEKESLEYALNNEGQKQIHSITCRDPLQEGEKLRDKVSLLLSERHMNCTGNITVYLGSISRNYCIEQIIKAVGNYEQREASLSKIALGCLAIGPSGEYIPNSFSLSPVLWSLSRILNSEEDQLPQGWLSKSEYDKENYSFEKTISEMNMIGYEDFKKITRCIINAYIPSIGVVQDGSGLSEEINLDYRMFKNVGEREKREGDYRGLAVDFYAEDLAMVLSQVEELEKKGHISHMQHALFSYIQSAFDMQKELEITRHDLIGDTENVNKETQYNELKEILDIRRAPLGKWPSRYMPFFMQQVAINLAIDEKHEKGTIFEDNGAVFSINGPPGTGKTALIKEIIANNVVERAILMAKYVNDPDDIFELCSFEHGPNAKTHAYAKYTPGYYRIRSGFKRLTNYAVVVASNNNAAVDNITVEIPDLKTIQDNLQPKEGDSDDLKNGLKEILGLFDPSNAKTEVRRRTDWDTGKTVWEDYNDLYFNSYADNFFSDERKTWGLISVPLGKRGNLNRFYKKVLNEMMFGPLFKPSKENRGLRPDERKQAYTNAVGAFLNQLKKVEQMRDEIASYFDTMSAPEDRYEKAIECRDSFERELIICEKSISSAQTKITDLNRKIRPVNKRFSKLNNSIQQIYTDLSEIKDQKIAIEITITAIRDEIRTGKEELNALSIFHAKRKKELKEALDKNNTLLISKQDELAAIVKQLDYKFAERNKVSEEKKSLAAQLQTVQNQIEQCASEIKSARLRLDEIISKKEEAERAVLRIKSQLDAPSEQYHGQDVDQFRVFTPEYYEALHSSDMEESVKAHLNNPWFTERYNREREKLFYYAMLLNKEFVLASNCCRSNLSLLGMAWHTDINPRQYYNDEVMSFAKADLEKCMTPLIQSLQLMVPVISTTFASVGSFFRFVKDSGSIGTLIIDEAGQAAPQAAVGALWRAHRAIIIGDPKQIEPVVTDDVSLLINAYGEDIFRCYAEKTLSVQKFADYLNCYGTRMFDSEEDKEGQWIGSPLTVHRRCISPMYDISNYLSYSNTMKQVTPEPSDEVTATLSGIQTKWLNISGKENGKKDHFVVEQGDRVLQLLDNAFKVFFDNHPELEATLTEENKSSDEDGIISEAITDNGPDLFIISPFNTVIEGLKQHLNNNLTNPAYPTLSTHVLQVEDWLTDWRNVHIGTVHKFQGREANEVIVLLGCDMNSIQSANWVKKNIVNVAVTRARYRLVIIGDAAVWKGCYPLMETKRIIDTYALKKIRELTADTENEENLLLASEYINRIPSLETISITRVASQCGSAENNLDIEEKDEYLLDNESVLQEYEDTGLLCELTDEQLQRFGCESKEMFNNISLNIRRNLIMGINLYDMLKPMRDRLEEGKYDVSFLAIPFCVAIEQSMQENYFKGLQNHFSDIIIRTKDVIPLGELNQSEATLGAFAYVIENRTVELGEIMKCSDRKECTKLWWEEYALKLRQCIDERDNCCQNKYFGWEDLEKLIDILLGASGGEYGVKGLFREAITGSSLSNA